MKTITVDKKHVPNYGEAPRVGDIAFIRLDYCEVTHIDGDRVTLKLPMTEREEFIERASNALCMTVLVPDDLDRLYDEGARFND